MFKARTRPQLNLSYAQRERIFDNTVEKVTRNTSIQSLTEQTGPSWLANLGPASSRTKIMKNLS
jgi:hypothetical protein